MISEIQKMLRSEALDGWLFFDHHRRDPLAYRILRLPDSLQPSRRWFYLIPMEGDPIKIVHKIEGTALDSLAGSKLFYASWPELSLQLSKVLKKFERIAMQYSPNCNIPYVSLVDGGTVEFVRSLGPEIASSANLVQEFEARWNEDQYNGHLHAGKFVDSIRREAFELIGARLRAKEEVTEFNVQQFILASFERSSLVTNHGPIVAVNANASNPHYEPSREQNSAISKGDLVLIDLWAKLNMPNSVYYDVTWTGFCGDKIPTEIEKVFGIVRQSRLNACNFVDQAIQSGNSIEGWQVDDVARGTITQHGLGEYFFHRTGHSIGTEVHGTGANMDNLESHDERKIIAGTCFSIEPGVYLPAFGIRSEVNVFVEPHRAIVTGEQQERVVLI